MQCIRNHELAKEGPEHVCKDHSPTPNIHIHCNNFPLPNPTTSQPSTCSHRMCSHRMCYAYYTHTPTRTRTHASAKASMLAIKTQKCIALTSFIKCTCIHRCADDLFHHLFLGPWHSLCLERSHYQVICQPDNKTVSSPSFCDSRTQLDFLHDPLPVLLRSVLPSPHLHQKELIFNLQIARKRKV